MPSMLHLSRSLSLLAIALFIAASARAVTFADGQVHVIDANHSYAAETVIVDDAPGGNRTSLHVLPGGQIATVLFGEHQTSGSGLEIRGGSSVVVSGGTVHG